MNIIHDEWCWKNKSVEVEVLDSDVSGVEFRQIGYILRCSLSHAITLVSALAPAAAPAPSSILSFNFVTFSSILLLFFFPIWPLQEFFQDGSKPENVGVYNLSKGVNRFCLSKPGEGLRSAPPLS